MKRRNFITTSAIAVSYLIGNSLISCKKESYKPNYFSSEQFVSNLKRAFSIVKNNGRNHDKIFLVSGISNVSKIKLKQEFGCDKTMGFVLEGYLVKERNLSEVAQVKQILLNGMLYSLKIFEKPHAIVIPLNSKHFRGRNKSFNYIEESEHILDNLVIKSVSI